MLGKIEGRKTDWQGIKWLGNITNSIDMNLSKLQETVKDGKPGVLQSMRSQRVRHDLATKQQKQDKFSEVKYSAIKALGRILIVL